MIASMIPANQLYRSQSAPDGSEPQISKISLPDGSFQQLHDGSFPQLCWYLTGSSMLPSFNCTNMKPRLYNSLAEDIYTKRCTALRNEPQSFRFDLRVMVTTGLPARLQHWQHTQHPKLAAMMPTRQATQPKAEM